jgi:cysteine-rich repeat protein
VREILHKGVGARLAQGEGMKQRTFLFSGLILAATIVACGDDESVNASTSTSGSGQGGAATGSGTGASQASSGAGGGAPACGDGEVASDEGCDDGNTERYDGCSDVCEPEELVWELLSASAPSFVIGDLVDDGNDLFVFFTESGNEIHSYRRLNEDWVELEAPDLADPLHTPARLDQRPHGAVHLGRNLGARRHLVGRSGWRPHRRATPAAGHGL